VDHQVTIALGNLAVDALSVGPAEQVRAQAAYAIRYYLSEKEAGRPAWKYPSFLETESDRVQPELTLKLDKPLWESLEREAAEQRVSPEKLAQHAVIYFVADRDAGRVPARIRAA
jgi:hypothetical protein